MQTPEQAAAEVVFMARQHRYIQKELGGLLILAPVELPGRTLSILDVGCGDGLVLSELHAQVGAESNLVGLDTNPAALAQGEATYGKKGIKLLQHDMNDPLPENLQNSFDLVHVRYSLYGAGRSGVEQVIKNLASALKPGGWLQVQEIDVQAGHSDHGEALTEYIGLFTTLIEKMGNDAKFVLKLKPAFEGAGLIDVKVSQYDAKFGKDAIDADESIEIFTHSIPLMVGYLKQLGVAKADSSLHERLKAELAVKGATFPRYVVMGRKA